MTLSKLVTQTENRFHAVYDVHNYAGESGNGQVMDLAQAAESQRMTLRR